MLEEIGHTKKEKKVQRYWYRLARKKLEEAKQLEESIRE